MLALLALTTAVLYWRALRCGIISDGWVVLAIGSQGPLEAMQVRLSYHVIPVTFLLTSILWKLFGLWEPGYQITNLAQLGISAWMLYLLGIRVFGRVRIALLAALLLVANASFYEVTFWPVIGNFQILAGLLQLGGILAALRAAESPRPAGRWEWSALFAVLSVAAFFTYEPAVSMLAVGPLAAALFSPAGLQEPWREWRGRVRRALPVLTASVLAFVPMVIAKVVAATSGETALFLPDSLDAVRIRIQFLVRACIAMFTLRGNEITVAGIFHLGLPPRAYGSPGYHLVLGFWAALFGALTLLAVFRVRRPAVIFLTLWFWIHIATVSIATIIVSRQYYLAALPAMLLLAWAISRAADAVAARAQAWAGGWTDGAPRAAAISASAAFLAFGLLAIGAKSDIDTAAAVYRDATLDARRVVEIARRRIAAGATPQSIALLDMPGHRVRQGIGVYPFINGLHEMLKLTIDDAVPRHQIHLYSSQAAAAPLFANATRQISLTELESRVDDPSWLVIRFEEATGTVVELNRATWKVPREYTAASAPFLQWQEGSWPWLRHAAGKPLEMPLALPSPETWGAVKFLRPGTPLHFDIVEEGTARLEVRSPRVQTPYWPVLAFPIGDDDGETVLTLRPETEVWFAGLWTFVPPARYTPESTPFLEWIAGAQPSFVVQEAMRLPVEAEDCPSDPCRIRIGYAAAPGRELTVSIEGGERRELAIQPGEAPGWRTVLLAAPSGREDTAVVRIEPRGSLPALLNSIEVEGTEVDAPTAKPIG